MYDNEENAVVNNEARDSETPADLVAKGKESELSPNPAGFGFTKQLIVDELPENGEANVLYLVNVKNNGVHVAYRKYKWTPTEGYVQFGATPDLKLADGERATPVKENNAPRKALAKVFNGDVAINNGIIYINGKSLLDYIDSEGGVTEEELRQALATLKASSAQIYIATNDITDLTATEIKEIVDDEYKVIHFASDENVCGYVLQSYVGGAGKYYLDLIADEGTGLKKESYVVDGTSVETHTTKNYVSSNYTGNVEITGGLKATTLEQSQANWSYDLSEIEPLVSGTFTAQNIFSRLQVVNKELEIIFTFSVTNTGETTATPANVQLGSFVVPADIGSKIIDVQGNPLTTSVGIIAIAGSRMVNVPTSPIAATAFSGSYGVLNISHKETKLFIAAYNLQGIAAGATHTYSGRIQLTLI